MATDSEAIAGQRWRRTVLWGLPAVTAAVFVLVGPIVQSQDYHRFADARQLWGIPNFSDVASNTALLGVGLFGLYATRRPRPPASLSWRTLFVALILVSGGSAYYHFARTDASLVWDRLPMTFAFTSMTVAVLTEFVSARLEKYLLLPALLLGAASIAVWRTTGDLRFYFWVQAISILTVLAAIDLFSRPELKPGYVVATGLLYGIAIAFEQTDREVFTLTAGAVSGHTIKHLFAALALLCFALRLCALRPDSFPGVTSAARG